MSISRLDSMSPTLAESVRRAGAAKRREAARVACEKVISSTGLAEQAVLVALAALRTGQQVPKEVQRQVELVAERLDDEYLRLSEEEDQEQRGRALQLFSMARAASALALVLSDDAERFHEAIYESIAASSEPTALEALVLDALR